MNDRLTIIEKLAAIDMNYRQLWDELDEENFKSLKADLYILNRWRSSVKGSRSDQEHYVLAVNEYFNKHFFTLAKDHSKLLWLSLCMCGANPDKKWYHEWIGLGKRTSVDPKVKFLAEFYPDLNESELELLAKNTTEEEIVDIAERYEMTYKSTTVKQTKKKK